MHTEERTHGTKQGDRIQERIDEIRKLRDEIRVKFHLAGMDARDAFKKIEPAVDKAEHEVTHLARGAAGAVTEAVAGSLDSLAESLRKLRARMPR